MLLNRVPFTPSLLFLPVAVMLVCLFTLGIGLVLSTMVIYFADVFEMFQILLMSWFYLQPIMYPMEIIPESRQWLFKLNPMYYFLSVFRTPIYEGHMAPANDILIAAVVGVVTFFIGWWLFTRQAEELAYRV